MLYTLWKLYKYYIVKCVEGIFEGLWSISCFGVKLVEDRVFPCVRINSIMHQVNMIEYEVLYPIK